MTEELNKNPMYVQLTNILRELIASDEYQVGDKFLTERAISERYGVSRATSNKALSALVSIGMLDFRKGVGTFVNSKATNDADSMMSVHLRSASEGNALQFKSYTMETKNIPASQMPDDAAEKLNVAADEEIFYIRILRVLDGKPAVLDDRYIVKSRCPGVAFVTDDGADFDYKSIYVASYYEQCRIGYLGKMEASLLQIDTKEPAFVVTSIGFGPGGEAIWWGKTYMNQSNDYSLTMQADFSEKQPGGYAKLSYGSERLF